MRGVVRFEQGEFVGRKQVAVVVGYVIARGVAGDVGTAIATGDSEVVAGGECGQGCGEAGAFGVAQAVVRAQGGVFGEVNVGGVGVVCDCFVVLQG